MVCELEQEMSQGSSEAPEAPQGMLLLGFLVGVYGALKMKNLYFSPN